MTGEELGCTVECLSCAYELLIVELEGVMHSLPHLEPHRAASVDDGRGEPPESSSRTSSEPTWISSGGKFSWAPAPLRRRSVHGEKVATAAISGATG
jgi:hypothetical protein